MHQPWSKLRDSAPWWADEQIYAQCFTRRKDPWSESWIRTGTGTGLTLTKNALTVFPAMGTSGVTAGTYTAATVTVDALGRVTAASGNTIPTTAAAAYTPTLTNVANTSALTANGFRYIRVGSQVSVYGSITATDSSLGVTSRVGVTLPVASNLTAATDCRGVSTVINSGGNAGFVTGDTTNDRAEANWVAQTTGTGLEHYMTFMYIVQ